MTDEGENEIAILAYNHPIQSKGMLTIRLIYSYKDAFLLRAPNVRLLLWWSCDRPAESRCQEIALDVQIPFGPSHW
jgi:hypothetical protein